MKIEFETFNQMLLRRTLHVVTSAKCAIVGLLAFVFSIFCFAAEVALYPIAKSRRAKAAYIRKLWRTRDKILQGRRGNGFLVKTGAENETH